MDKDNKTPGAHARSRRRYSAPFKSELLAACQLPDASVSAIAVAHGMQDMKGPNRPKLRQEKSTKVIKKRHAWLMEQRGKVPEGTATARAIDYSLWRWGALTQFLGNAQVPIKNN